MEVSAASRRACGRYAGSEGKGSKGGEPVEGERGAAAVAGGPVGRPTPDRKRRTLLGSFTKATSFILPPQRWQSRTST